MEIVYGWWREIDLLQKLEVHMDRASDLLVKKGISNDADSAKKVLLKYLEGDVKGTIITRDDFN